MGGPVIRRDCIWAYGFYSPVYSEIYKPQPTAIQSTGGGILQTIYSIKGPQNLDTKLIFKYDPSQFEMVQQALEKAKSSWIVQEFYSI